MFNVSEIMKRAWEIKKSNVEFLFDACLAKAWNEAKVKKAVEIAEERMYEDYRITLGTDRRVKAKRWENASKNADRTYINIQCFTGAGNYKGSIDCGYIDNNTNEYVTNQYTKIDLSEETPVFVCSTYYRHAN